MVKVNKFGLMELNFKEFFSTIKKFQKENSFGQTVTPILVNLYKINEAD
jgi:hypothetical protein